MTEPLVARLREESAHLSGRSIDRGCVDSGIAANLADEAADELARLQAENEALRRERDEARGNLSPLTLEVLTDIQKTAAELREEDFRHVSVNTLMGAVKMFIAATRLLCQTAEAETAQKASEAAREAAEAKAARLQEALKQAEVWLSHMGYNIYGVLVKDDMPDHEPVLRAARAALEAK